MRHRLFRHVGAVVTAIAGAPALAVVDWTSFVRSLTLQVEFLAICAPWLLVWVFVGIWAFFDAKSRNMNSIAWFLVVFFLGLIGLIVYFVVRRSHPVGGAPPYGYPAYGYPQPYQAPGQPPASPPGAYYPGPAQPPATPPGAYYPAPAQPPATSPAAPPAQPGQPQAPTPAPGAAVAFCRNCGNRLQPGAKFCATCGASV